MEEKNQWMEAIADNILQDRTRCEGWLFEHGMGQNNRSFFKLSEGKLNQYSSPREKRPDHTMSITPGVTTVFDLGLNTFTLTDPKGAIRKMEAETAPAKKKWVNAISSVCSGELRGSVEVADPTVILSGRIIGAEVMNEGSASYTVYLTEVSAGSLSWIIRRRFSEYAQFQQVLCENFPGVSLPSSALEVFKTKTLFGSMKNSLVLKRRALLQEYLSAVLSEESLHLCPTIREFFETEEHMGDLLEEGDNQGLMVHLHVKDTRSGAGDAERIIEVAPAMFGANILGEMEASFVKAEPIHAATLLHNKESCKGAIVLVERGVVSFGTKAINIQKAGAVAMVVINNVQGESLSMDLTEEEKNQAADITIPLCMIDKAEGDALRNDKWDSQTPKIAKLISTEPANFGLTAVSSSVPETPRGNPKRRSINDEVQIEAADSLLEHIAAGVKKSEEICMSVEELLKDADTKESHTNMNPNLMYTLNLTLILFLKEAKKREALQDTISTLELEAKDLKHQVSSLTALQVDKAALEMECASLSSRLKAALAELEEAGKESTGLKLRAEQAEAFKPAQSFQRMMRGMDFLDLGGSKGKESDMKQMQDFTNELIHQIGDRDQALEESRAEKQLFGRQMQAMQDELKAMAAERDALLLLVDQA